MFELLNFFRKMEGEPGVAGGEPAGGEPAGGEPAGGTPPGGEPAGGEQKWYSGLASEDDRAWASNKSYDSMDTAIGAFRGLEKMVGAPAEEVVRIPANADEATMASIYDRLGRPKEAAGYEFPQPEGHTPDTAFETAMRDVFHKTGLSAAQGKAIVEAGNEYTQATMKQAQDDYNISIEADKKALQDEWKGGYERQMKLASTAASTLGFTPEMIDSMEQSVGYGETMRFFSKLAQRLGEDNFVNGDGDRGGNFGSSMTPAEAKAAYNAELLNPEFTKALMNRDHPGHKSAIEKKAHYMSVMHG